MKFKTVYFENHSEVLKKETCKNEEYYICEMRIRNFKLTKNKNFKDCITCEKYPKLKGNSPSIDFENEHPSKGHHVKHRYNRNAPIKVIETGVVYKNTKEICEKLKITKKQIYYCIRKNRPLKSYGWHLKYEL